LARYKTFEATGIAPNGRLYAGDLNAIQDTSFGTDFTTTLDVGTLRVGDPTLQLLKYGTGEFRMSGSMRFDGITRGLGGIISGAFTTSQRDAIPVGSRPYGLIILNTTENVYQWNAGTDNNPVWNSFGGATGGPTGAHAATHLPGASDALAFSSINLAGLRSAKPAASAANNGLYYFETDWNAIWRSNGSLWVRCASFPRRCTTAQFGNLPDYQDADEVFLEVSSSTWWHLRYNSSGGAYKWQFVGGPGIGVVDDSTITIQSTGYVSAGPAISIPRPGIYNIAITCTAGGIDTAPHEANHAFMSVGGPGQTPTDANGAASRHISNEILAWAIAKTMTLTFSSAGVVTCSYRGYTADAVQFFKRTLQLVPAAIG
jgi:hypothetical protein